MADGRDKTNPEPEEEFRSYGDIVWRQFKKYDFAYWCLHILGFLLFVALIAPIIALDVPFYLHVPADLPAEKLRGVLPSTVSIAELRGSSFPWFRTLVNTLYFDNPIDQFFNFLLFTLPVNILLWLVFKSRLDVDSKRDYRSIRALFIWASVLVQATLLTTTFYVGISTSFANLADIGPLVKFVAAAGLLNLALWGLLAYTREFSSDEHYRSFREVFILFSALFHISAIVGLLIPDLGQGSLPYAELAEVEGVEAIFPPLRHAYWGTTMETHIDPNWAHLLGTDGKGRDVLARLIYGTRISLTIGLVAQGIATAIGIVMGSIAGYFGGKTDMVILRIIEVFYTFPALFVIFVLAGFIEEPNILYVMVIIGLVFWTRVARLVRGEYLRLREEEFVQAAQALGLPERRVIFRHILPNALGPVLVYIVFGIAGAILFEAIVSFLGVGDMSVPSWGQILRAGDQSERMLLIFAPGIALFITVTAMYLVGEGVQDAMDPKLRE